MSLGISFPLITYITISCLGYFIYGNGVHDNYLITITPDNIGKALYIIV